MEKFKTQVQKLKRQVVNTGMSIRNNLIDAVCNQRGQGTTEYAILVGVLVVIAILAIVVFRPKLEQLWRSITDAMEQL